MRATSLILCLLILNSLTEDIEGRRWGWRVGKRNTVKNAQHQPPFYQSIVFENFSIKHSHFDDFYLTFYRFNIHVQLRIDIHTDAVFFILYFDVTIILISLSISVCDVNFALLLSSFFSGRGI